MSKFFLQVSLALLLIPGFLALSGCGGSSKGAAVTIVFSASFDDSPIPNATIYLSVIDDKGKSVYQTMAVTDDKGVGFFDGLPSSGKYTLQVWMMDGPKCSFPADMKDFSGDQRGKKAGDCRQ